MQAAGHSFFPESEPIQTVGEFPAPPHEASRGSWWHRLGAAPSLGLDPSSPDTADETQFPHKGSEQGGQPASRSKERYPRKAPPSCSPCQGDHPSQQPHLSQRAPLDRLHHHRLVLLLDVKAIVLLLGQDLRAQHKRDSEAPPRPPRDQDPVGSSCPRSTRGGGEVRQEGVNPGSAQEAAGAQHTSPHCQGKTHC